LSSFSICYNSIDYVKADAAVHNFLIFFSNIMIALFTRFTIRGKENIPRQGALMVVANHLSSADPVIIGAKLDRRMIFMAKEELFRNWIAKYFVVQFGAFPVYRAGPTRDAIRQANRVLKEGGVLGMFPEGHRSADASMNSALFGSALIAYTNHVPILPIGISGSEKIHGYNWMWHRPAITLKIGPAFYLPEKGEFLSKEQLAEMTDIIMNRISELLPEKYQGEYNRLENHEG
jgi:1-acyl-sn-glycerol-3-phosphate acyltransferase